MDMTTDAGRKTFVFPLLKLADILLCLEELGIEMTKEEVTEPHRHKEKLRKVYLQMLEACTGKIEEDFIATPDMLSHASTLPHPELHAPEHFQELQFYTALRDMMVVCGYHEFSFRDMHSPISKRLRQQLSGFINLAKYREQQLHVYAELHKYRSELLKSIDECTEENTLLSEQLGATEIESAAKQDEMDSIMMDCQGLEQEIAHNNRLQAAAREEAGKLKKQANDLKDELASSVWALQESEAEEERLRMQVVSSPDRRKKDLTLQKECLDKEKQECAQLDLQIQECKTKIRNAQQATKDVETALSAIEDLKEAVTEYEKLSQQREQVRERIHSIEKKTLETRNQTEELERNLQRAEDKIVHQRKQQKLQMAAVQEALDAAKKQLVSVEKERRDGMSRIEAGEAEVRQLHASLQREQKKTEAEIQQMMQEYQEVEHAFLERDAKRMTLIGSL